MIEATCSACGTLNRFAGSDVPAGAKFVTCSSCKSRVPVPVRPAAAGKIPAVPPIPKLPPPVPKGPPSIPLGPAGAAPTIVPPPAAGGINDIIDLSDLPAPKRPSPLGPEASRPAPRSALAASLEAELPVPKAARSPIQPSGSLDLDDLMEAPHADLPAPKVPRATTPRPADPVGLSDLPAPKHRTPSPSAGPRNVAGLADLPAPRPGGARAITDLPAPAEIADLPAPRGKAEISDLPAPRRGSPATSSATAEDDQLTPKAPGASADLPAPKGFFDDLPQPARKPQGAATDDLAPKGFFDDLPQPARKPQGAATDDLAPKGFFDDLPQKALKPDAPQPPAPKGFFDDLPQPSSRAHGDSRGAPPRDRGGDEPIDALELDDGPGLDLGPSDGISLDGPGIDPGLGGPALDLDSGPATGGSYDDLDLSAPTSGPGARSQTPAAPPDDALAGAIRFDTPKKGAGATAGAKAPLPSLAAKSAGAELSLELEEPRPGADRSQRLGPRPKDRPVVDDRATKARAKRRRNVVAGAVLGVALLGAGGFYFYQRHAAAQERADRIGEQLEVARTSLVAEDAKHWQRAAVAANNVIELDPKHAEALGIAAEASIAGAIADGKNATARITQGSRMISDALGAGLTGPALERAQALAMLTSAPDKAVPRLKALLNRKPKDGLLALYLGWAAAGAGDAPAALKAYDQAIASSPAAKVLALLGRARVNLSIADLDAARADFDAVLAIERNNIPAQVGLAATLPQAQSQQKESDLLAILARKDIAGADPRAVVQAWVLAGDVARLGGRLDAARERYRKALAVEAKDVSAMTGLAEVELRDDKIDLALEHITQALTQSRDDVRAQLVASEIELGKGKLEVAAKRVDALAARTPPLAPIDQARLELVKGRLLEKRGKHDEAVDAYVASAKLSGEYDLTPTMAAISKLSELAKDADREQDAARATELRSRADQLLAGLAANAEKDVSLALTLGIAYQQAGDPAKAEPLLRRVLEVRPDDVDAIYQLGKVLLARGRGEVGIVELERARKLAPLRAEIGLELARAYEATKRDAEAGTLYDALLAGPEPSLGLRGYAGQFYVRTGKLDKAGEQGEKIVEIDHTHPAGHYLKGEGLLAAGKFDLARKEFMEAVSLERDAAYLDGQGRATEQLSISRNHDLALQDQALNAYKAATELDPKLLSSLIGQGRLYVARREMEKAVTQLLAANQLAPKDAEISFLLGAAYQKLGTKEHKRVAVKWLKSSMAIRASAETSYLLGELYADPDVNSAVEAASSYGSATRLAFEEMKKEGAAQPHWYPDALFMQGRYSLLTGNEVMAKKAWEQWLGLKPPPSPGAKRTEVERELGTRLKSIRAD